MLSARLLSNLRKNYYAVVSLVGLKDKYIYWTKGPVYIAIAVAMAERIHLFSFRTQKLSSPAPKVLCGQLHGRIGRRRISLKTIQMGCLFSFYPNAWINHTTRDSVVDRSAQKPNLVK